MDVERLAESVGATASERTRLMTSQMDRIEWKLDQLLLMMVQGPAAEASAKAMAEEAKREAEEASGIVFGKLTEEERDFVVSMLQDMTPKQHATLQMLMNGKKNQEIAERFGVTLNTAKVFVRTVMKRLKVKRRADVMRYVYPVLRVMDDATYRKMSSGLPVSWDEDYNYERREDDPFWPLYGKKTGPVYDRELRSPRARGDDEQ